MRSIVAVPLTRENYRSYGHVIEAGEPGSGRLVNQGTALRFNHLAPLENLRGAAAPPNVCLFRAQPRTDWPFDVTLLEHHPFSTQLFIPMNAARYVVVVASQRADNGKPDESTIAAFLARGDQAVTYAPGVFHHPLLAVDAPTDFACIVHEDGTGGDCTVVQLGRAVQVTLPTS